MDFKLEYFFRAWKKSLVRAKADKTTRLSMICHCGNQYYALKAELMDGHALTCSLKCGALRRHNPDKYRPAMVEELYHVSRQTKANSSK